MNEENSRNPFAPPAAADISVVQGVHTGSFYVEGDCLVVGRRALLPDACVHCGTTELLSHRDRKLTYVNTILIVLLLVLTGPLIVLIAYLATRKTLVIRYSVCQDCAARRRSRLIPPVVLLILSFVAIVVGVVQVDAWEWGGMLILAAIVTALISVIWLMAVSQGLSVKRYSREQFWVRGFSDEFLRMLGS